MPGAGQYVVIDQLCPEEVETTSNIACRSSPSLSASAKASQVTSIVAPRIMLLQIFAAWPLPGGPQWTALAPMIPNSGSALAKASSLPPAMKVSVPASAPPTPPETGASTGRSPAAMASAATARALSTSTVEQSTKAAPACIAGMMSLDTARRISPLGSMVMTTSAPCAASAAEAAARTPEGAGAARSNPVTSWPAAARFRAIGAPMFPNPMNPIFTVSPPSESQLVRPERREHGGDFLSGDVPERRVAPMRGPVAVDQRGADAFDEIPVFRRPPGEAEFGRQRVADAAAPDPPDRFVGAGGRQRALALQRLKRRSGERCVVGAERRGGVVQRAM